MLSRNPLVVPKSSLDDSLGGCEVLFLHAGSSLSDFFLFISHFASVNEAILWKLLKKKQKQETKSGRTGAGAKKLLTAYP